MKTESLSQDPTAAKSEAEALRRAAAAAQLKDEALRNDTAAARWLTELGALLGVAPRLAPRDLGAAYAGEDTGTTFRVVPLVPVKPGTDRAKLVDMNRAMPGRVTEYWDDDEANRNRARIDEQGAVRAESALARKEAGYVIDPSSGDLLTFKFEGKSAEITDEQAAAAQSLLDGSALADIEASLKTRAERGWAPVIDPETNAPERDPLAEVRRYARLAHDISLLENNAGSQAEISRKKGQLMLLEMHLRNLYEDFEERREFVLTERELKSVRATARKLAAKVPATKINVNAHHSSPLAGEAVAGAGMVVLDDKSRIQSISNLSGHYKPTFVHLLQTIELLLRRNALQDDATVYLNDAGVAIPLEGPVKKLHELVIRRQDAVKVAGDRLREATAELDRLALAPQTPDSADEPPDALRARLESIQSDAQACLKAFERAEKALHDMGVQPTNRVLGLAADDQDVREVRVGFLEGMENKTGRELHAQDATSTTVGKFLTTGGGAKVYDKDAKAYTPKTVARARDQMHDELLAKSSPLQAKLNPDADDLDADKRAAQMMQRLATVNPAAHAELLKKGSRLTEEQIKAITLALDAAARRATADADSDSDIESENDDSDSDSDSDSEDGSNSGSDSEGDDFIGTKAGSSSNRYSVLDPAAADESDDDESDSESDDESDDEEPIRVVKPIVGKGRPDAKPAAAEGEDPPYGFDDLQNDDDEEDEESAAVSGKQAPQTTGRSN